MGNLVPSVNNIVRPIKYKIINTGNTMSNFVASKQQITFIDKSMYKKYSIQITLFRIFRFHRNKSFLTKRANNIKITFMCFIGKNVFHNRHRT